MDVAAVEARVLCADMRDLEVAHAQLQGHLRATASQQSSAEMRTKVAFCELEELERKVEEARIVQRAAESTYRAHLNILKGSLSSMEREQSSALATPPVSGQGDLSDLHKAVTDLEYLLDGVHGAPPPPGPISTSPDQLCALLLEHALGSPLGSGGVSSLDDQARMVVSRAIRALGRRAGEVASAMSELATLQAILEGEIQQMEAQGPAIAAGGAGG